MTDKIAQIMDIVPLENYKSFDKQIDIVPENDADLARRNIKDLLDKTSEVFDELIDVASSAQNDKMYAALSAMMKTRIDANKELLHLSKTKKEIEKLELDNAERKENSNTPMTTINNNLFVSSSELLDMILNKRKEKLNGKSDI